MRAFVTGATGFLGGHVAQRLHDEGHDVVAFVRPTSDTSRLDAAGLEKRVGDITDAASLRAVLDEETWDLVVHAAAIVDVVKPDRDRILAVNVNGTRHVLDACGDVGVERVVHVSSIAALGDPADGLADETTEIEPPYVSPYAESKHKADVLAGEYARAGLPVVRVNPSIVIGADDPKTGYVLRRWLQGRIRYVPRVAGTASYVHVEDAVDGLLRAAAKGRAGDRYVLTQENLTHDALVDLLVELTGQPPPHRIPKSLAWLAAVAEEGAAWMRGRPPRFSRQALAAMDRRHAFSSQKARDELGWRPEEFKKRLAQTLSHLREGLHERR